MVLFLISLKRYKNSLFRKQSFPQYSVSPMLSIVSQPHFSPYPLRSTLKAQIEIDLQQTWSTAIRCHKKSFRSCIYHGLFCLSLNNITAKPWCVLLCCLVLLAPAGCSSARGCCEGWQLSGEPSGVRCINPMQLNITFPDCRGSLKHTPPKKTVNKKKN